MARWSAPRKTIRAPFSGVAARISPVRAEACLCSAAARSKAVQGVTVAADMPGLVSRIERRRLAARPLEHDDGQGDPGAVAVGPIVSLQSLDPIYVITAAPE